MRMVSERKSAVSPRAYVFFPAANDDSEDTDSHDEEDDETNDRVIPVTQDFYSADDIQMNDETSPTAP